jgi:hypothetical protein
MTNYGLAGRLITLGEWLESGFARGVLESPLGELEIAILTSVIPRELRGDPGWERSRGLSYYCEGELVVSLGDECDCVAVAGLEGELVSGVRAAGA